MEKKIIDKIGWIYIQDKKVLVARSKNKDKFYAPGGKRELGETDEQALIREVKEEVSVAIIPGSLKLVGVFEAEAHGQVAINVRITAYTADFVGEIKPDSEIEELNWFNFSNWEIATAPMRLILDHLKKQDLID